MTTKLNERRIKEFNACYAHYTTESLSDEDYSSRWTRNFFATSDKDLFSLMIAAQEGEHKLLTDTVARYIAAIIDGQDTPEQLRERFGLEDDLTDKEKETVRKEYGQLSISNE